MIGYALYVVSAAGVLVLGIVDFRDRLKSFFLWLCATSIVLLFALRSMHDLNSVLSDLAAAVFFLFGAAIYVASNLVREIVAALNREAAPIISRKTARLWLPLPIFLLAATVLTGLAHQWIAEKFYSIQSSSWHCREPNFFLCRDASGSFKSSLHSTNSRFFADANTVVRKRVEVLRPLPLATEPVFRAKVDEAVFGKDAVIPSADDVLPRRRECPWYEWLWPPNIPNCLKAIILNPIHDAYARFRTKLQNDLDQGIIAEFEQSQTTANNLANLVILNLDRLLQHTRESLDTNIDRAFFLRDAASLLSFAAAVLLSLKILLYILVRLAFDKETSKVGCSLSGGTNPLSPIRATEIIPTATSSGRKTIGLDVDQQVWYITTSAKGAQPGFYGQFCWPHKSGLFLRRLIHNKLFFNRYPKDTQSPIPIHTEVTNAFCSIELKEGDCFAFSMSRLFAFTESVTFHLAIRMRAAILLQRRFLFATATGPGTIVLVGYGGMLSILPNPSDRYSNIDHVIGLDLNGSIFTRSHHGFIDMYFRSFSITPDSNTLVVREAPVEPEWALTRLIRRFAALVLPF